MTVYGNGTKTKPYVSSKYGPRTGGAFGFHYGTDFTGYSAIHAVEGGVVTGAGYLNDDAGNVVAYDLPEKGPKGETVTVVHMHLKSVSVSKGAKVTEAQRVGVMGDTGNATGACDHIEIRYWLNGKMTTVDPEPWLASRMAGQPAGSGQFPMNELYGAEYVKAKQIFLKSINLYNDVIDGLDGFKFQTGTKQFQTWTGLSPVDGLFGPDTGKMQGIVEGGRNMTTRAVADIQKFLKAAGFFPYVVDNQWGNQSSLATLRYQRANTLTADAVWGAATDKKAFPPTTPPPVVEGPVGKNITTRPNTEIQALLKTKGLYEGPLDGQYGAGTTAAVVALQKSGGLEDDGIWGAVTDVFGFFRPAALKTAVQGVTVNGGTAVTPRKITGLNLHHYGSTSDDRAYFAGPNNGRKSCPTAALDTDGKLYEYIPPRLQPWSTGVADKDRIAVEMRNLTGAPEWQISGAQIQTLIVLLVELRMAAINKTLIDGMVVELTLDRQHIQGDQEFRATACPGPYVMNNLDGWIAEAQRRVDVLTAPPEPEPTEMVEVSRGWLEAHAHAHQTAATANESVVAEIEAMLDA